ncbi:hypothetical protein PR048_015935 [Dryococelus australis]|uniref:carbonic anhydrase n=1 Tax=Dryococelus australis TaxID=614101 RepID=A0ABQ9HJG3_9NEOP|nr:hypothetical protein PR048_015935 [Dryococelus australis]
MSLTSKSELMGLSAMLGENTLYPGGWYELTDGCWLTGGSGFPDGHGFVPLDDVAPQIPSQLPPLFPREYNGRDQAGNRTWFKGRGGMCFENDTTAASHNKAGVRVCVFFTSRFSMEAHVVHFKKAYGNVTNAFAYSDGIAVVAFFLEEAAGGETLYMIEMEHMTLDCDMYSYSECQFRLQVGVWINCNSSEKSNLSSFISANYTTIALLWVQIACFTKFHNETGNHPSGRVYDVDTLSDSIVAGCGTIRNYPGIYQCIKESVQWWVVHVFLLMESVLNISAIHSTASYPSHYKTTLAAKASALGPDSTHTDGHFSDSRQLNTPGGHSLSSAPQLEQKPATFSTDLDIITCHRFTHCTGKEAKLLCWQVEDKLGPNKDLSELTDAVPQIAAPESSTSVPLIAATHWFHDHAMAGGYLTYQGSLTTPPCSEVVTWVVYPLPVTLSEDQVAASLLYTRRPATNTHCLFTKDENAMGELEVSIAAHEGMGLVSSLVTAAESGWTRAAPHQRKFQRRTTAVSQSVSTWLQNSLFSSIGTGILGIMACAGACKICNKQYRKSRCGRSLKGVAVFRTLKTPSGSLMLSNYRPTQDLNGRRVRLAGTEFDPAMLNHVGEGYLRA